MNEETLKQDSDNSLYSTKDFNESEKIIFNKGAMFGAKWQAQRIYSDEEEVIKLLQDIVNEIEVRKQNIISNSGKMQIHLLEGGCMAFESSQDVVIELFKQFKKK